MPSPIDYDKIPGADIQPDAIEENARTVGTISGQVAEHGSNVNFTWQGMATVYEAPESPTLLGLMAPVSSQATQAGDNLAEVSAALVAFAAEVRPIKAELDALRADAKTFVDSIQGGVQVREINPAWTAAQSPYGGATTMPTYQGSWGSSTTTAPTAPEQYRTVTKEWHESQEHVDRNNELLAAVNAQQVKLWEAERACANRIRALYGAAPLRAAQSEDDSLGYGISEIPEGTEMPWGAEVERTEGCGEATVNFVFKDFLWEGIAVGGIWGTVEGLGTLVLGYNPATGDFFSGEAYGAAWGNLGMLLFAGAANTGILAPIFQSDSLMQSMGMDGFLPQEVRDFKAQADEAAINTGKALIAWDKWQDDPGTALGESVFNVGTALIPVGGAAVAGVKTASTAASVVSKMARVVDFVDPAALAMNGAVRLGGAGLHSLDGLIGRVGSNSTDAIHLNTPDMPLVADGPTSALSALDGAGVDLGTVTARVDDGVPVYEFPPTAEIPSGRIEMPAGSFDGVRGADVPVRTDLPGRAEGGMDATVTAREPELVAAGGVRGETGPAAVDSIVADAPVRSDASGSSESTVVREPSPGTGGGSSHAGGEGSSGTGGHGGSDNGSGGGAGRGDDAAGGGRADDTGSGHGEDAPSNAPEREATGSERGDGPTDAAHTDGPVEGPAHRGDPIDPGYGQPRAEHGALAEKYLPPETIPEPVSHLVTDPAAPFGRGPDGHAFTRGEWESRYVDEGGGLIYPGNDGAVPGTRVTYTDVDAFQRDYGATLDRFGGDGGTYFAPEGSPFEARGLPGSSLSTPYRAFGVADQLPPGVRIEVSEVAPAFGQPGGGFQVQFVHETSGPIRLFELNAPDGGGTIFDVQPGAYLDVDSGSVSDLATTVPGSTDVVALHGGSVPIEHQPSLLRREYPGFLGINSSRYTGGVGQFDLNCTRCVIATDRLFDGDASSAMPVTSNGAPVTDISRALGTTGGFQITDSWAAITDDMTRLPVGSRGVVLIERQNGIGHVVNVVHDRNGVVFLDAQSGRLAHLEDAFRLRLLITKGNVT
ncbi:hypothetical protein FHS07_001501 [Microbacterium proteolyticum]|uniref:Papain fold toxin 1, glutamine deamidase n=1 Tax=Microbacterium proteolyticum TaxID=1572644 RepID=A0A7W5CHL2_9MICO|nr:glycohydrolase toxin TNT-related protein [Microbacterium proteolyticum]MBB3157817.1 hypothetical protein [Microbacterium proteolyticum]